MFYFKR